MGDIILATGKMTSLEIAKLTGKRHSHILRDIDKVLKELEIDWAQFRAEYTDESGKANSMYALDKRLSLILATGYSIVWRTRIIDRWEELEKAKAITPQIPQTFAQALLLASKQAEEIEALEEMRAINAPLVEFAKTVQTSETDISVEQFAKATFPKFWLGRNTMFKKLRELGFLKGDNLPYQQYVTQGLFRVIETVKFDRIFAQTLITGKGQVLLEGEIV